MSLRVRLFVWKYDLYIGVYRDPNGQSIAVHPLPCIGFEVQWGPTLQESYDAMLKQLKINNAERESERSARGDA